MACRGWFYLSFFTVKRLVIMMALFRFSRLFGLSLLMPLETFLVSHFSTSSAVLEVSLISVLLVVLSVFLGAVFLAFLLSLVRLPFSSPVFFSLFLNFRLLARVGLGSCLFCSLVRAPFPSSSHACFYRLVNKGKAG